MTHELGPLPKAAFYTTISDVNWATNAGRAGSFWRAQESPEELSIFTADQMRSYAAAEVARAVAAERERCAKVVERKVLEACPHLKQSEFAALIRSGVGC